MIIRLYIISIIVVICGCTHSQNAIDSQSEDNAEAQITDTAIFPLNEYLIKTIAYPFVTVDTNRLKQTDTSKFVSVIKYGAKGDGKTLDDAAIANAFKAAQFGVIFPAGHTYLISKLFTLSLTKNLIIYAYGATIKMADLKRYSFLDFIYPKGRYTGNFIWLGGTLDGNKDRQSWPGSPTHNNAWAENHGQFMRVENAAFFLIKDLKLINTVMDGIGSLDCRIVVYYDNNATGGAQIQYSTSSEQATYFKARGNSSHALYCDNLNCDKGSIGIQYSTKNFAGSDSAISIINNCVFTNQWQNSMHFEDCRRIFINNCVIDNDTIEAYKHSLHISNQTYIAIAKGCQFRNTRLNFNQASKLKLGIIDSCSFLSETKALTTLIEGRAILCFNSNFAGPTKDRQAEIKNVRSSSFKDFGNLALWGAMAVDSCQFDNGITPASFAKGGFVINSMFTNVAKVPQQKPPVNNDWKNIFNSSVIILSDKREYLGIFNFR